MTDTETPEVTARVEENWAALEIDGETQTIRADTEEEVRHEVLRRAVQIAADAQTDVHLIATDRDGEWRLIVTPEGGVSEIGVTSQSHGAHEGNDVEPDAAPANPIAAPPTAGTEVVPARDAGSKGDPRPYYDFSGPVDDGFSTGDTASTSTDTVTVNTDTLRPDAGQSEGSLVEEQERLAPPASVIIDPPSLTPDPTIAQAEPAPAVPAEPAPAVQAEPAPAVQAEPAPALQAEPAPAVQAEPAPAVQASPAPDAEVHDASGVQGDGASDVQVDDASDELDEADAGPVVMAATGEQIVDAAADPPVPGEPTASAPMPGAVPASVPSTASGSPTPLPTLADFQATQPPPVAGPASRGWRGALRRGTGGLISPKPSGAEQRHREAIASVTRSLSGPRTICVINPKGGAHKTTATMLIAATFGMYRGGYTLAWDNNETRGTLGWRAHQARHTNTAVNLLNDIDRFTDLRSARVGDLDNYVRSQAEAQFDVLASDEDAAASSMIDGEGFRRLHETLQRFYRILVVDTGNNMRASNWEAAIAAADQLVIVSAIREDTAGGAAWMVEGLARKGNEDKLRDAVTILSAPDKNTDAKLRSRLFDHFGSLTRDVVEVPYDPALVSGGGIAIDSLAPTTREAWLTATATIANGL